MLIAALMLADSLIDATAGIVTPGQDGAALDTIATRLEAAGRRCWRREALRIEPRAPTFGNGGFCPIRAFDHP